MRRGLMKTHVRVTIVIVSAIFFAILFFAITMPFYGSQVADDADVASQEAGTQ